MSASNYHGFDSPVSTTTRSGHVVTTTRMPPSAPALFETRVSLNGKEVEFWDCNHDVDAVSQHEELVAKHGGAPIEAPEGLTAAEYFELAIRCLDQGGLARQGQLTVAKTIEDFLRNNARTIDLVGADIGASRSTVGKIVDELRVAS